MRKADLAYLSACATGRVTQRLPDEAIHLASAFQLAGYRHLLATLWAVGGRAAMTVAKHFYKHLADENASDNAGVTLHEATRRLRFLLRSPPAAWGRSRPLWPETGTPSALSDARKP